MNGKWIIPGAAALAAVVASLISYADLPEQMAIHFGINDQADRYAHKALGAFLAPAVIMLLPLLTNLNMKLEHDESKRNRFGQVNETINTVIILLLLAVHLAVLGINLGYDLSPSRFGPLALGIVFVLVGNVLPRTPQGPMRLFKMKDEQYARYARFSGRALVAAGFLLLLSAALPDRVGIYFALAVIAALIIAVIGSSIYVRRK